MSNQTAQARMVAMMDLIEKMGDEELRMLNSYVVDRIRTNQKRKAIAAGAQFQNGQRVSFYNSKKYKEMTGTIIKINPKTIRIATDEDGIWNVTSTMLRAA